MTIIVKICATCELEKPISEFNLRPHKTTYESDCKVCQKEKMLTDPDNTNSDYIKKTKESGIHVKQVETPQVSAFIIKSINTTTKIIRRRKL